MQQASRFGNALTCHVAPVLQILHQLGLDLRRLARLDPPRRAELLQLCAGRVTALLTILDGLQDGGNHAGTGLATLVANPVVRSLPFCIGKSCVPS